jgi:hypothetical protein
VNGKVQNDRAEYIARMCETLDISLPPEELGRVELIFGNLQRLAEQLRDAPMDDEIVPAAVYLPWCAPDDER